VRKPAGRAIRSCIDRRDGQSGRHQRGQAETKTKSQNGKAFAQQVVTDHSGVNKAATDLVKKLNVTTEDNSTS
jgi:hypothetical protein